jgi:hypothetical protein
MGRVIAGMSMSLDGFVTGPNAGLRCPWVPAESGTMTGYSTAGPNERARRLAPAPAAATGRG